MFGILRSFLWDFIRVGNGLACAHLFHRCPSPSSARTSFYGCEESFIDPSSTFGVIGARALSVLEIVRKVKRLPPNH
jgi:hypothetical protein